MNKYQKREIYCTVIIVILLLSSILVFAVPASPPKPGGDAPAKEESTKGSGGDSQAGFVEIMPGKYVSLLTIHYYFKIDSIKSINTLSESCKNSIITCSQKDVDLFRSSDWRANYDPQSEIWSDDQFDWKISDDGKYVVSISKDGKEDIIIQYSGEVATPYDTSEPLNLAQITKIENNKITFQDGSVLFQGVLATKSLHDQYGSQFESVNGKTIQLKNGGSILSVMGDNGVTTTNIVIKDENGAATVASGKTWTLPDGTILDEHDNWKESNGVFSREDEKVTVTEYTIERTLNGKLVSNYNLASNALYQYNSEGNLYSIKLKDGSYYLISDTNDLYHDSKGNLLAVCQLDVCKNMPNGDNKMDWVDADGICRGTKSDCFDAKGSKKPDAWTSEETIENKIKSSNIDCSETPTNDLCQKLSSINLAELGRSDIQQQIGEIVGYRPGWQALSTFLFPSLTREWNDWASDTFDQLMFSEYIVPEALCKKEITTTKPGESSFFIEVAPGIIQSGGTIHAEKRTGASPALCSEEVPCHTGQCAENGVCYENDEAVIANFYKISWAVKAPADEKFTPYKDENGVPVRYNVELRSADGGIFLYHLLNQKGNKLTLGLENGQTDHDTIVGYSPIIYDEVCILFGLSPKDLSGELITEICNPIVESTVAETEWAESADRPAYRGTTRASDVVRVQI